MAAEENDKLDSSGKVVKLSQSILESVGPYLEYAPDGVYISDLKGTFLYGNRKAEEIIKYSREELIGQSYLKKNLLPANELVKAARLLARNALGKPTGPDEFELTGKDGSRVLAEINTVHIVQKGEKLVLAFVRDITERKKMEKSLQQTETRFKELFENISNGVAVYKAVDDGQDFIFIDFNKAGEKIEYLKKEDVVGQSVQAVFPGIKEFGLLDVFKRVWKTGKPEHHPVTLYQDKRIISWRENYIYKLPSGEIVAVYEDITERINQENEMNRIEQQYRQVQRLESIGRLAGGVAHDLNNMLTPILGYSELLLAKTASDDKNREPLEEIVKASNRASTLVRQLLAFSRRQTL